MQDSLHERTTINTSLYFNRKMQHGEYAPEVRILARHLRRPIMKLLFHPKKFSYYHFVIQVYIEGDEVEVKMCQISTWRDEASYRIDLKTNKF